MACDWGKLLEQLQGQTKTKIQALDTLQNHVQTTALGRDNISSLLDYTPQLLSDNNFKVALKLLKCWQGIVVNSQDLVKPYIHGLLPPVVERLGDNKQDVRQAACDLLLDLLQVLRPDIMMDKLSRFWGHKNWKVRHGLLQFVAEAVCSAGEAALLIPRDDSNWVLHKVIQLVGDPESAVRDAAIECLEEVFKVYGEQLMDVLSSHQLRPAHLNLIYSRLAQLGAQVEPTPEQSCEASSAHEEQDTASSAGGAASSACVGLGDEVSSQPPSAAASRPATRQHSSAGQLKRQGSEYRPEDSLAASKSTATIAAAEPRIKRGGFGDGGGVTKDGGLPPAPVLSVSGERELVHELERIIDSLNKGTEVDWEKRVNAMVRLEGLIKGGAIGTHEACFMEHLRALKDPLLDQMVDRRSAVARQCAHLFAVMAAALGIKFEAYAITFMTAVYKGLVITVQVVSEASDAAARGILHHCHAPRLVPQVCDILTQDKSAKLRKHCSGFLLQVLEGWESQEYGHYLDQIEAALTAAVQDALGETRTNGRTAFAAYAAALPERAAALLRRFDSGLQQKLHEAVVAYSKGHAHAVVVPTKQRTRQPPPSKPWKSGGANNGGAADPEIVVVAPPPPSGSQRAPRPASGRVATSSIGAQRSTAGPSAAAPEGSFSGLGLAATASAMPPRAGRKSVAGVPMRVPGGSLLACESSSGDVGGAAALAAAVVPGGRRRTSMMPQRVPYNAHEAPGRSTGAVAAGYGRAAVASGVMGGADLMSHHMMVPDSPESCAHSDTSGMGEGTLAGLDHKGVTTRSLQPHPKQLAARQAIPASMGCGGDDLQTQLLLRDQQHQMQQAHMASHHAVQQYADPHHQGYVQDRSGSSLSAAMSACRPALHGHALMMQPQAPKPATLSKAVAGVLANPKGWKDREDTMDVLAATLNRQLEVDSRPEAFSEVEKVVPKLLSAIDDAHFKVSTSALKLLTTCTHVCPGVLESNLDKLMPLLFLKLCAGKQSVRSEAEAALQALAMEMDADVLMPALNRSLEVMKQPAARVSVMEFVVLFMGVGCVAGQPTSTSHLRHWVSRNIPLLLDKNPNVRQMAGKALATIYSIDPNTVVACLQHATPQEVAVVQRSLADAEARAAAEEGAAAAAEEAAAAAHSAAWAHHANGQQALSVSSSADMSQSGFSAAGEQHQYGAYGSDYQAYATEAQGYAGEQHVQALGGNLAGLSLSTAAVQQQQQLEQQQQYQQQQHFGPAGGHASMGQLLQGPGTQPSSSTGYTQQVQQQQQFHTAQQQPTHQQYQHSYQQQQPAVQASSMGATAPVEGPRDVLGRPVAGTPVSATGSSAAAPASAQLLQSQAPQTQQQPAPMSTPAGPSAPQLLQPAPQQQAAATVSASPQGAAVGAAAMAAAAAVAAGDAGSQARHLTVLVHRLQSRPAEDVLAELAACASVLCSQAWQDNFSKVLLAGLSAAQNSSESIRELAFLLVLALAQHHSALFEPVLDVVLQPLLQGCGDESREVLVAAQQALDVLMQSMPPLRCVDILAHKLPSEDATSSGTAVDGEVLCATIRSLQLVAPRMTPSELLAVGPSQLLPGLFAAFHHPRPDVRKAVVFCLVDMWHAAGEGLTPYLASLSTSQLKLLTIYYNRAQGKQQAESHM